MIELGSLALISALGGVLAVPAVLAQYRLLGWMGRRRNKKGLCCRCKVKLYAGGSAPSRIGGVLFCPKCTTLVRRAWTVGLWSVTGLALLIPVVGALGMMGLVPFISGGVTVGAIAGMLVPPTVMVSAIAFEMRHSRRVNAAAALEEGESIPELVSSGD